MSKSEAQKPLLIDKEIDSIIEITKEALETHRRLYEEHMSSVESCQSILNQCALIQSHAREFNTHQEGNDER